MSYVTPARLGKFKELQDEYNVSSYATKNHTHDDYVKTDDLSTSTVGEATKATQDADGNVISTTYALKSELPEAETLTTEAQVDAIFSATYTVTITQTDNQTITVTCDGVDHTETFEATFGSIWTATVTADSGYKAGTLEETSGEISYDITISATEAKEAGREYVFYDENNNVISSVAIGDTPYYYSVDGGVTKSRVGGPIFYINESAAKTEDTYYVYYPTMDTTAKRRWTYFVDTSAIKELIGTSTTIGSGKTNTKTVMEKSSGAYVTSNASGYETIWYYIKTINTNSLNGCNDWYIGSKLELEALRLSNLTEDTIFAYTNSIENYWNVHSSSESATNTSEQWDTMKGRWDSTAGKTYLGYTVALRSF